MMGETINGLGWAMLAVREFQLRHGRRALYRHPTRKRNRGAAEPPAPLQNCSQPALRAQNPAQPTAELRQPSPQPATPFPVPTVPRTPSPDEPAVLRSAFGTRPPRKLRPAKQDDLFNPNPQIRPFFTGGQ